MRCLVVDDERAAIENLERVLGKVLGTDATIVTAVDGKEAVEIARLEDLDVAFLDIEMPEMNGLELAKKLKDIQPELNLVMVTAYPEYALQAWRLHVSDYLMKPADEEDVKMALANLRNPVRKIPESDKKDAPDQPRLKVQCFGNFEVFYNNEPVPFGRSKAKELFAYLVSLRGSSATTGELCGILWEDADNLQLKKTYLRQYLMEIRKAFSKCGMDDVVIHNRNAYSVNTKKLDCDYYRFHEMDSEAINSYHGEFMIQYSWAEMVVGELEKI